MSKIKNLVVSYEELRKELIVLKNDKMEFILTKKSNYIESFLKNSNFNSKEELREEFDSNEEFINYVYGEKEKELEYELNILEKEILRLS